VVMLAAGGKVRGKATRTQIAFDQPPPRHSVHARNAESTFAIARDILSVAAAGCSAAFASLPPPRMRTKGRLAALRCARTLTTPKTLAPPQGHKVLVVGSGGREHALAWKLAQSDECESLYCAPGSPGTAAEPGVENVTVDVSNNQAVRLVVCPARSPVEGAPPRSWSQRSAPTLAAFQPLPPPEQTQQQQLKTHALVTRSRRSGPPLPHQRSSSATLSPTPTSSNQVVDFCKAKGIDLVMVGPEAPLVAGLVDALDAAGVRAFGPSAAAAQLEGSKKFMKVRRAVVGRAWRRFRCRCGVDL